jgi:hypothetical protein
MGAGAGSASDGDIAGSHEESAWTADGMRGDTGTNNAAGDTVREMREVEEVEGIS